MNAYNRVASGGLGTPTPPSSPMWSPRFRHSRSKVGRLQLTGAPRTLFQRLALTLLSIFLRRQSLCLFAPLIYISGMLLYMGSVSLDVVPIIRARPAPGSIYRSPQIYHKLRSHMNVENSSEDALETVWRHAYRGGGWKPCVNVSLEGLPDSNGYIYVEANGGLNQQRTSIGNAVAIAGYLNATLVIPNFHYHSVWKDPSKFMDIYDTGHFTNTLKNDVRVVPKLPDYIMERFDRNMSNVFNFKIKAWAPIRFYKDHVLPKLLEDKSNLLNHIVVGRPVQNATNTIMNAFIFRVYVILLNSMGFIRVIRISPFANRLSWDAPPNVQRLRCLANFEALKFSYPISSVAENLVMRMKQRSNKGKYVAVHLRFEEDMVAFSCCVFDGGEEEIKEMDAARERGWRGKFTRRGRIIQPGAIRLDGKCPLTPLEVGLMLRGMGFGNNTAIFLASGKIYRADKNMVPLLEMFPLLQTKETLAMEEELAPFKNYSSRMAAIDYSVCLHSEVFVTTQGGNFPHFLIGHRRYLYSGHAKTIRPDKRKLALLLDNPNISWKSFKRHLLNMRSHSDAKGIELKRPNDSIYTYPCPDCMCRSSKTVDHRSSES